MLQSKKKDKIMKKIGLFGIFGTDEEKARQTGLVKGFYKGEQTSLKQYLIGERPRKGEIDEAYVFAAEDTYESRVFINHCKAHDIVCNFVREKKAESKEETKKKNK